MTYLIMGTSVVWIGILGYMIILTKRQNHLFKKLEGLERRLDS